MDKVILNGIGIGDQSFDLDHAERILNIKTPPRVWKLNDPLYKFEDGKILKVEITVIDPLADKTKK